MPDWSSGGQYAGMFDPEANPAVFLFLYYGEALCFLTRIEKPVEPGCVALLAERLNLLIFILFFFFKGEFTGQ